MSATRQREPKSDECYCSNCGEIIEEIAEICPECGVRQERTAAKNGTSTEPSRIGKLGYTVIGLGSGLISFLLVPVIFGPLSIFCGYQIYKKYHELLGLLVMAWGGVGLVLGMIIGMMMW